MQGQSQSDDTSATTVKDERGRSAVEFTYTDLNDSEELCQIIHSSFGMGCSAKNLAGKMNQSAEGGGFRMKLYSARTFGLVELNRGGFIEMTDLGLRIIDPKHSQAARVEAFLRVPLYAKMFRDLEGKLLPPIAAIDRMMLQAGVAPKQKERARQVFLRSAKHAGFFEVNADRLLQPHIADAAVPSGPSSATDAPAQEPAKAEPERRPQQRFYGGGGGDGTDGIHPALLWLLRELPAPGTAMLPRRKEQLKAAFATNLDFIYPDPEDAS